MGPLAHAPVEISAHARDRFKERTGLPKRAARRMVVRAWSEGVTPATASGDVRTYLASLCSRMGHAHGGRGLDCTVRLFRGVCFLFVGHTAVTCWRLPEEIALAA